jgi:hypothetical protein
MLGVIGRSGLESAMEGEGTLARAYSIATLRETRAQLRTWWGIAMVTFIGLIFGFISLLVGQMLVLEPIGGTYGYEVVWGQGAFAWWNYPGLIVVEPWGLLALPFLPTLAMALVSYGVGLGMSIALLIGARMLKLRRSSLGRPTAVGSVSGLTPAMIALVTLGACCSTTAAATAGIGVAAQTSGSSVDALLENNWYLNVFQLVILWVALIAQEQLLLAYGIFFDPASTAAREAGRDRWAFPRGLARVALLIGGVTWSLATLASWTTTDASSAGPGWWGHWILQQQVPALLAIAVAIAPAGFLQVAERRLVGAVGTCIRALLVVTGATLVLAVPPALVGVGWAGWVNELLGSLGLPASQGAASFGGVAGWGLAFHWVFQLWLLGGLAVAVGVNPRRTLRLFAPSSRPASAESAGIARSPSERPALGARPSGPTER